jgi:type I restriction enzyme, S subunit
MVLGYISSEVFVDYTTAVSTGTRMPRTNWKNMSRYEIAIPTEEIANIFNSQTEPMLAMIQNNIFESRILANLRDTLLPCLMSGQLRVPVGPEARLLREERHT